MMSSPQDLKSVYPWIILAGVLFGFAFFLSGLNITRANIVIHSVSISDDVFIELQSKRSGDWILHIYGLTDNAGVQKDKFELNKNCLDKLLNLLPGESDSVNLMACGLGNNFHVAYYRPDNMAAPVKTYYISKGKLFVSGE